MVVVIVMVSTVYSVVVMVMVVMVRTVYGWLSWSL